MYRYDAKTIYRYATYSCNNCVLFMIGRSIICKKNYDSSWIKNGAIIFDR